jgi:hypothetical protein
MRRRSLAAPKDSQNARRSVLARTITPISCAKNVFLGSPPSCCRSLDWSVLNRGYSYPAKSEQIRGNSRKSPESRWRLSSVAQILWSRFLACGRVSVRGSRSILQEFQRVGSNFLYLGTPLLNAANAPDGVAPRATARASGRRRVRRTAARFSQRVGHARQAPCSLRVEKVQIARGRIPRGYRVRRFEKAAVAAVGCVDSR